MEACIAITQYPSGINFKYSEWDGKLNLKYPEGNLTLALLILHLPEWTTGSNFVYLYELGFIEETPLHNTVKDYLIYWILTIRN